MPPDVAAVANWQSAPLAAARTRWIGDARTLGAGATALLVAMLAAAWVVPANASFVVMVGAALLAGIGIASVENEADRRTSVSLLVWALTVRVVVLTCCFALAGREGGPFLGADSSLYYYGSRELAEQAFHLPTWPVVYFGSYDVGQYYLFAAAVRFAHADLFGLQMVNCALTAIAVSLTFGITRLVVPRGAVWISAVAALHPSLIGISVLDLLKDPSIVCAVLGLMWLLLHLSRASRTATVLTLAAIALPLSAYLRVSRFYAFAYIEAGFAVALAILLVARRRPFERRLALIVVLVLLAVVELLPMRALWPPTPVMFVAMAGHTLNTPGLRFATPGMFERGRRRQPTSGNRAEVEQGPGLIELAIGVFRRTFGPYPWILPKAASFRGLQDAQFYLFPGMLLWYAVLPLIVIGFVHIGLGGWRAFSHPFGILLLWSFSLIYFAQYLLINLSYRQREVMLSVLLVFGWLGFEWVRARPRRIVKTCYLGYATAITLLAALHLAARAWMSAT